MCWEGRQRIWTESLCGWYHLESVSAAEDQQSVIRLLPLQFHPISGEVSWECKRYFLRFPPDIQYWTYLLCLNWKFHHLFYSSDFTLPISFPTKPENTGKVPQSRGGLGCCSRQLLWETVQLRNSKAKEGALGNYISSFSSSFFFFLIFFFSSLLFLLRGKILNRVMSCLTLISTVLVHSKACIVNQEQSAEFLQHTVFKNQGT